MYDARSAEKKAMVPSTSPAVLVLKNRSNVFSNDTFT
jgi:hypothetical protein